MRGVTERFSRTNGSDERGATAVIVALSLIALLGMIVLTVDVGQLLFRRRAMVNGSDAGALAAAQSCAGLTDSDSPEAMSDVFAIDNVNGLVAGNGGITDVAGCDGPPFGHVTVQYQIPQELFFAGVLGFNGPATVRTASHGRLGTGGRRQPAADRGVHGQRPGQLRHPGGHRSGRRLLPLVRQRSLQPVRPSGS